VGNSAYHVHYDRYDPSEGEFGVSRSVHSSWFGVLAELGYPGFFLFATIIIAAFRACFVARAAAARGAPKAFQTYALALEMGLVAFAVGGSFVILHTNEVVWHFIGMTMALHALAIAHAVESPEAVPTSAAIAGTRSVPPAVTWKHA
jgi:O-antigen ligase